MDKVTLVKVELDAKKLTLKDQLDEQKSLLAAKEQEQASIKELKNKRESYYREITSQKQEQKALVKLLKQQASATQSVIDSLIRVAEQEEKQAKETANKAKSDTSKTKESISISKPVTKEDESHQPKITTNSGLKGLGGMQKQLPWPVQGKVVKKFGQDVHPRFNTVVVNNGIDIAVEVGMPIKAVAGGQVVYAKWLKGVGKVVIIFHGNGYHTLYGHLSRISVVAGDAVKQGQTIGDAGSTDSAEGEVLHFELHIKGKPQNPTDWLK
jgi:septal ring factor EnvC (AmiA/AmiB activator)